METDRLLPSSGSLPNAHKGLSEKLILRLLQGCQGPKHLLHPRIHISRKLEAGKELEVEPRVLKWDAGISVTS